MKLQPTAPVPPRTGSARNPVVDLRRRRACVASLGAIAGGLLPGLVQAATFPLVRPRLLHAFDGQIEGRGPNAPVVRGADGAWYGTAFQGGPLGQGTAWRTTDGRTLSVLHAFAADGGPAQPTGPLAVDADGSLYGRTFRGGPADAGTIYRLSAQGEFTLLHAFAGPEAYSTTGLLLARDGRLYGTTFFGGEHGFGTVFRLARDGSAYEVLYAFRGWPDDGSYPDAELIEGSDGMLYGTTSDGGPDGGGTVFRMAPDSAPTILHIFSWSDGAVPSGPLVESTIDGAFYGTTRAGGFPGGGGPGTVFRITAGGSFERLHTFAADASEGLGPESLLEASDGHFYGCGTAMVFRMQRSGKVTPLYAFRAGTQLQPGLSEVQPGVLVGSTHAGGPAATGSLFALRRPA